MTNKNTKKMITSPSGDTSRMRPLTKKQKRKTLKQTEKSVVLPGAFAILRQSILHLYKNKKLFFGILFVYGLLYLIFVKGISGSLQLSGIRENLDQLFGNKNNIIGTGFAMYGVLLGSAGASVNESGSVYQIVLLVLVSLALIFALRATYAKEQKITVKDAYYRGMYPLLPFVLVSLLILVEIIPIFISTSLFTIAQNNGLIVGSNEKIFFYLLLLSTFYLSFYMISSSIIALYIVTLPSGKPVEALRSARKLIKFKRINIIRKLAFLPFVMLIFSALTLIPIITLMPVAAEIIFTLYTILAVGIAHSYFYTLYRSLL